MSCFPERVYSVYVDGELAADEVREVESHLVQCRRCRVLILALQDEAAFLTDLFPERVQPAVRAPGRARARGLAVGLVPALGLLALVVTVAGWLLERRLPPGMRWMNPLGFADSCKELVTVVGIVACAGCPATATPWRKTRAPPRSAV